MIFTINFNQLDKSALPLVGGKNASLGEMIKAGIRVPPGFAVTTDSYLFFLNETGIEAPIFRILKNLEVDDIHSLNQSTAEIQDLIGRATMPQALESAIKEAYSQLGETLALDSLPAAIRSSATAEDLPTASFAGQQDTYLWITGGDQVIRKVQSCWASLFTPRATSYRVKNNFDHEKVLISVGVQKMVNAKSAGVMFTLNPIDGDLSKMVIEGNWGLGETVVSGSVNPDKFVVDKVVMETNERTVSSKQVMCVYDPDQGKVVLKDVEKKWMNRCCLSEEEVKELVRIGKIIETHYRCPMDIEWAIDQDLDFPENIFMVQARPETVWSQRKVKPVIGQKSGYQLLMEQAMKRIKIP